MCVSASRNNARAMRMSASLTWSVVTMVMIVYSTALPTGSTTDDVETTTITEVATASESETQPRILNRSSDGRLPPECTPGGTLCVPKCCPVGQTYMNRSCVLSEILFDPFVKDNDTSGETLLERNSASYFIVVGLPCPNVYKENETDFFINGSLVVFDNETTDAHLSHIEMERLEDKNDFCLEYTNLVDDYHTAFLCLRTQKAAFDNWLYTVGLVLSVTGLILTLIFYLLMDELRDLHGKSLICHVGTLAVFYVLLASLRLSGRQGFGDDTCRALVFTMQFFLLSSYMWLHVMIVDSMWAVLHTTGHSLFPYPGTKIWSCSPITGQWVTRYTEQVDEKKNQETRIKEKNKERYIFCIFIFYVHFFSLLPITIFLGSGLAPVVPAVYVDETTNQYCEMNSLSSLYYFYPVPGLITVLNVAIFIVIIKYAVSFQWNSSGSHRVPKQKARMCFILFLIMSSNWIIEMVSLFLKGRKLPLQILQGVYVMQGTITFVIFIMEDRVKYIILNKLPQKLKKLKGKYGCDTPTKKEEVTEH